MANYEMIAELFQDNTFQQEAASCQTMDDFHQLFNSKGAEISHEETAELICKIAEAQQNDELDENMLEDVNGGIVLSGAWAVAALVGLGVVSIGACVGSAYVAYQGLRWAYQHKHKK